MCGGARQFVGARGIRKCHESHVSGIDAILISNDPGPSLNTVSCDKKSASVRQADGPTNFNPILPRQKICSSTTKKSASVRQPLKHRVDERTGCSILRTGAQ